MECVAISRSRWSPPGLGPPLLRIWRVEGFVTNLTNELYVAGVAPGASAANASAGVVNLGLPRQFGMRVQYTY